MDNYVLQNLHYSSDLVAGQFAYAFKFADRTTLNFNCQIELTFKDKKYNDGCLKMVSKKISVRTSY